MSIFSLSLSEISGIFSKAAIFLRAISKENLFVGDPPDEDAYGTTASFGKSSTSTCSPLAAAFFLLLLICALVSTGSPLGSSTIGSSTGTSFSPSVDGGEGTGGSCFSSLLLLVESMDWYFLSLSLPRGMASLAFLSLEHLLYRERASHGYHGNTTHLPV